MQDPGNRYHVYGMTRSYFTRKLQAYLDYKRIPYVFRRFGSAHPEARAAGWPGGVPVVQTPEGDYMWDTTAMILHLEARFPEPAVLPPDPVRRFLCFAIEDAADEWLYRPAVGSRWFFEENRRHGVWELARDVTCEVPIPCHQAAEMVASYMIGSCAPFGVTQENVRSWIDEVFLPWLRVLHAHFQASPFLFGARPSLADFAIFGGDAAHFVADPLCRRWVDDEGPAVVQHTHRLLHAADERWGDWAPAAPLPETLLAVLRDMGRLYLPWVSRATLDGAAELAFAGGQRITIAAPPFLRAARAVVLGRYRALRCEALDAVLARAGILSCYADHVAEAGAVPADARPPRPQLNRPFAPPEEAEADLWDEVSTAGSDT
jgi:glutathione S-transferase